MEPVETESALNRGWGTSPQREPSASDGEYASKLPTSGSGDSTSASREKPTSQALSEALDKLLERLPTLFGDERTKAKKEFLELAAKSHSPSMELVTKSTEVAKRVTGSVKQEWEARRERADSYVHAYPFRAMGISVMIGVLLGAIGVGSLHRHESTG
ncbi:hypothetical protein [Cupriavidus pauculus]|uniref:DUF883 domain-containing protein n=1 Tax=Cupriavidus pauculus TaxID=82633 RepID=A0A2N5C6U2_9BURK|nr:hypothetical protein [Cupriavidus pauculus]PLP97945.1 hypothetical protein CYJ10_24430 [Cupriavidus pauculus]